MNPEDGLVDVGLSHVGLMVSDVEASVAFYGRYAGMEIVHRRDDTSGPVVWVSDRTRPFVIVLIEVAEVTSVLAGFNHLGVAVESRDEVDRLASMADRDARLVYGPIDDGDPVGYWAFIRDPDGHMLEVSYGQEVGLTVDRKRYGDHAARNHDDRAKPFLEDS